jgi:hypothetical protein
MNSNHKNGEFNSSLEDDLDTIGQAYRDLGQEEPPALLDQAVLNSAHRAVEKQSHWMQFGWLHGLTTVAVVVLAFTIILQQGDPGPGLDEITPLDPAMQSRAENTVSEESVITAKEFRKVKMLEVQKQDVEIPLEELIPNAEMADMASPPAARLQTAADEADAESGQAPSLLAEPETRQAMGMAREQADAEKELQQILRLKRDGDESWQQALELFIQRYPDYPLPEGLAD